MKITKSQLLLFPILVAINVASAASVKETSENISKCARKDSQTICISKQIYLESPKSMLTKNMKLLGKSRKYSVQIPSSQWYRLWPHDENRQEDLIVMGYSGRAFVHFAWEKGQTDYIKIAQRPLKDTVRNFKAYLIELDVRPFDKEGVLYEICYEIRKKIQECIYSAAAALPGGVVSFYSLTQAKEEFIEDVIFLITSIDQP